MMADAELRFEEHTRQGSTEERVLATRHQVYLTIPGTPPSFNTTAQAHWTKHRKAKRDWQEWLTIALMEQQVPQSLLRVEAQAELQFPTRRRRDEGNFRVILEKSLGDALVGDHRAWPDGRWLPDDTPDRYTFGRVEIVMFRKATPQTIIKLTYYLEEEQ
jgi:hypothetical protein